MESYEHAAVVTPMGVDTYTLQVNKPKTTESPLLFSDGDYGQQVGRLFINSDGKLDFSGDLTESAKQLINLFNQMKEQ